ncbi:MAG: Uncharacterised protein [Cryomorphaceae bacterium]|nr:MAG: Uncharacterised protein [Cryomorphaceae bacterium]|tara:strand:+ start:222 stop:653 length:432 start_codon:yes stop_codon:yes gene_type:complete
MEKERKNASLLLKKSKIMKNLILILFCLILFLNSCIRTECENCTKLFDTQFSNAQLDLIVHELVNNSSIDSVNYQNWNEFITINFPDLNFTFEECSKYGGMVSVDPLGNTKDFRQVWYSDGSKDVLPIYDSIFEIGTIFYDCE